MSNVEFPLEQIRSFCDLLINQQAAKPIVIPQDSSSGFWFGGGNTIQDDDGHLLVVGRYRNAGDSRTGIAAGTRGLELAIFRSQKPSNSQSQPVFDKVVSWSKSELNCGDQEVLSIEGSCLRKTENGFQLFVSTEKSNVKYPDQIADFQKPGAGVWTIDVVRAASLDELKTTAVEPCLQSSDPEHLHVKDPFFWNEGSNPRLGFCSHPFNWSSSNTCRANLNAGGTIQGSPEFSVVERGTTWDVAMTRGTSVLPIASLIGSSEPVSLLFYCGGECVRELDQHSTAVSRPRGYSCEEIGGTMLIPASGPEDAIRVSNLLPQFISPTGTGCSRYVDVCETPEGYYASWQQSQADFSQPLVMNFVSREMAESCF